MWSPVLAEPRLTLSLWLRPCCPCWTQTRRRVGSSPTSTQQQPMVGAQMFIDWISERDRSWTIKTFKAQTIRLRNLLLLKEKPESEVHSQKFALLLVCLTTGISKLPPQIWPNPATIYFCRAHKLKVAFTLGKNPQNNISRWENDMKFPFLCS